MQAYRDPYRGMPAFALLAAAPTLTNQSMESLIGWFDLVVIAVLALGIFRGRKRGMSQELLDLFQWLAIVLGGALLYEPVGRELSRTASMNLTYCYVVTYVGFAVMLKLAFHLLKRSLGEKLVGSDMFGRGEYYLGMVAGAIRFLLVLWWILAVMHAPEVTEADRRAMAKKQREYFEGISFPTFGSLQYGIFYQSYSGQWLKNTLPWSLINPGKAPATQRETIGQQRQREVDSIIGR